MSVGDLRRVVAAAVVLLGTCAGASAWQPPRSQPVEKAQSCPEMGEGFVKIAGSGTCIRVGGSVRAETMHSSAGASYLPAGR